MISIRAFTEGDVPLASELRRLAGWNQTDRDWRGYLEFEPEGCFVAEVNGVAAGTATTITYGDRFGWIGMVLVHPEQRRFGIGTALLRHSIAYLQRRGVRSIKLDATPMGKKVYVPLGFVDEYDLARYEGVAPIDPASFVRSGAQARESEPAASAPTPLRDRDLRDVVAFDAPIFGAERRAVIESLARREPEFCFVARYAPGVAGYLIAREGANAIQLGPWLANDAVTADALLRAFFARVPGRRVFVDALGPNSNARAQLENFGFTVQRPFARMYLGENVAPGDPARVFGTSGAEKG